MTEKLSIKEKGLRALAIESELTIGSGVPIWLFSALLINFASSRSTPVTRMFSTAKIGVNIVAATRAKSAPKEPKIAIKMPRRRLE
jgi:hypothetical protein